MNASRLKQTWPGLALALAIAATGCASKPGPRKTLLTTEELAKKVHTTSGGDQWHTVRRLRFTFNVESEGKLVLAARHDWNVAAGTDTVSWTPANAAPITATVRVDQPPAEGASPDEKAAYARWTNDAYWLLMPLKLFDGGVNLLLLAPETINDVPLETLELSFGTVGLTPKDRYRLYIDPAAGKVRHWDYIPAPDRKLRFSWDNYVSAGPLTLSTEHRTPDGKRRIFITDLSVETHPAPSKTSR